MVESTSVDPNDEAAASAQASATEAADRGLKKLLDKVHDFGFCFITSVPTNPEDTEKVIRRIAPIRETHYGGFWDFTADLKMGDMAYTNEALPAHTDNTYFVSRLAIYSCQAQLTYFTLTDRPCRPSDLPHALPPAPRSRRCHSAR